MTPLRSALGRMPLVGIVRGCPSSHLLDVVEAAVAAGLEAIELTMDSPDAVANLTRLRDAFPDVAVGAGTVMSVAQVEAAANAAATYIVSPVLDAALVDATRRLGLESIPGASTPSEIHVAIHLGATIVKVFPATQLGGPEYLRAVRGILGNPDLMPTGGVRAADVAEYLAAGAFAVAVGSAAFARDAMADGDADAVGKAVAEFVAAARR